MAVANGVKHKRRRPNWTDDETRCLIAIWEEHQLDLTKNKRNGFIYTVMADQLAELGYSRSKEEIQTRLSNLCQDYRKEKSKLEAGSPSSWKFWNEVHSVREQLSLKESAYNLIKSEDDLKVGPLEISSEVKTDTCITTPTVDFPIEPIVQVSSCENTLQTSNVTDTDDSSILSANSMQGRTRLKILQKKKNSNDSFQRKIMEEIIMANEKADEYELQTIELQKQQLSLQQKSISLQEELLNIFKTFIK